MSPGVTPITARRPQTVTVQTAGQIRCWGNDSRGAVSGVADQGDKTFSEVTVNSQFICTILVDGDTGTAGNQDERGSALLGGGATATS